MKIDLLAAMEIEISLRTIDFAAAVVGHRTRYYFLNSGYILRFILYIYLSATIHGNDEGSEETC